MPRHLLEGFFINDIGHLREIAVVVFFQHVDQALYAASRHTFIWVGGKACDARRAGKVRHKAAAVRDDRVAQG